MTTPIPPTPYSSSPRPSIDSLSSGRQSPIQEVDPSAALILAPEPGDHDELDEDAAAFEFLSSSDDDSQDEGLDGPLGRTTGGPWSSVPPLSSLAVFLYLLSPLLKLGALLSSSVGDVQPLKITLPALFFFASVCALTRQIWYILARYVRKPDMEEILLQAIARGAGRGREGERKRRWIKFVVQSGTGLVRLLLISLYLRASTDAVIPLLPPRVAGFLPSRPLFSVLFALIALPLSLAPSTSLGATTVLSATWLSVAAYIAWVAGTAYAHAKHFPIPSPADNGADGSLGALWQGLSVVAFTFATSSTLPLYSALRSSSGGFGSSKPRRSRSFKLLSLGSIALAVALILPPTLFRLAGTSPVSTLPFNCIMAFLSAAVLVFGIPSVLVTAPALPVPLAIRRHVNHLVVSRVILLAVSLGISLTSSGFVRVTSDILLFLAFLGTFTVPALLHIVIHNLRRPLSIVMPPTTPRPGTLSRSDSHNDELLQRKERTLQRRRWTKRLLWDIGVWVLLLPVGGGGVAWAVGRLAGKW
ncbi:hypothetical protein BDW22DRAFT_1336914 [Trametopsis cervina]|nr:hypothetical protein BDW22DRAFT_1336914 [Trametopsis cervina]